MSSKFAFCFPSRESGKMVCQHHNGSWIVFPMTARRKRKAKDDKAPSKDEAKSEDGKS